MKEIRIIVAGSRDFDDYSLLKLTLKEYINGLDIADFCQVVIISGAARGADTLGEYFAYDYQIAVRKFPAKWDEIGKRAGWVRNAEMAKYAAEKHGVLFAFWDGKSRGTKNMIDLANRYSLEVHVVNYE